MDNESSYDASLIRSSSLQFSVFQPWTVSFTIPLCRLLIIRRPVSIQFEDPTIIQLISTRWLYGETGCQLYGAAGFFIGIGIIISLGLIIAEGFTIIYGMWRIN